MAAPVAADAVPISGTPAIDVADGHKLCPHGHHSSGHYHGGHIGQGGDGGAAAADALFGFFLGSMFAAGAARQPQAIEYCRRRFRSYDPYSGTYLGYDGSTSLPVTRASLRSPAARRAAARRWPWP